MYAYSGTAAAEFDFDTTPSLTLEPELEPAAEPETPKPQPKPEEPVLTPEEQKMVSDFAAKIDVENTAQILQYGAAAQKNIADFSEIQPDTLGFWMENKVFEKSVDNKKKHVEYDKSV